MRSFVISVYHSRDIEARYEYISLNGSSVHIFWIERPTYEIEADRYSFCDYEIE